MTKATINLKDGRAINIELYEDVAPISVANFIKLAKAGFYNGLIFHRVIGNFMIQGGGFDENMDQKSCPSIKGEFKSNGVKNDLKHTKGVLSMARTMVKDSASSQFFICVTDTPHLDGQYAAFGKTADDASSDIAVAISKVATSGRGHYSDVPVESVVIESIEVRG
jgi:peptidyl-prolyl cis-trans isomerase B (cyclophilin B)